MTSPINSFKEIGMVLVVEWQANVSELTKSLIYNNDGNEKCTCTIVEVPDGRIRQFMILAFHERCVAHGWLYSDYFAWKAKQQGLDIMLPILPTVMR